MGNFCALVFVFFPAIVPRAYTLPAVRYTLIKYYRLIGKLANWGIGKLIYWSIGKLANWSIGEYKLKRRTTNVYTICEQFLSSGIKFF